MNLLREDLPVTSTVKETWSYDDISKFDAFREYYKTNVALAKRLYEKDVVRQVPKEVKEATRENMMTGYSMMVQMELGKENMLQYIDDKYTVLTGVNPNTILLSKFHVDTRSYHSTLSGYLNKDVTLQMIRKVASDDEGKVNLKSLSWHSEVITAIYVPEHIESIDVVCPNFCATLSVSSCTTSLTDMLKESKTVPTVTSAASGRDTKKYKHKQKEIVVRNGVRYRRVVLVQPYLPTVCIKCIDFFDVYLGEKNCTIYVEHNSVSEEYREELKRTFKVLYVEGTNLHTPLLYCKDYTLMNVLNHEYDKELKRSYIPKV